MKNPYPLRSFGEDRNDLCVCEIHRLLVLFVVGVMFVSVNFDGGDVVLSRVEFYGTENTRAASGSGFSPLMTTHIT